VTSGDSRTALVHRFFTGTGFSYDRIVRLLTIGLDNAWKEKILEKIPTGPARILDQACGTGILTYRIAKRFAGCRVTGVELRREFLDLAMAKADYRELRNVDFILGRAENVVLREKFDCITSSYLAKYADLKTLVRNACGMLRSGGVIVHHDFTCPRGPIFPWIWERYLKLLKSAGSRRYPEWRTVFHELPALLRRTRWVGELVNELEECGCSEIRIEPLFFGTATVVTARTRDIP
jgi:demethylmenaquinone methyltransferase/2-methoxy-6-polyprenyl-1,4-benzoquinol methylase